jgi:4-diphosphocytidyl-2C-methyl-D-erythritol kinase
MHLLAPAKINLHLRVGRRRDDGFHPLLTWMCTVGLFDSLTLEADADVDARASSFPARRGSGAAPPAAMLAGDGAAAGGAAGGVDDEVDTVRATAADVELVLCGDGDRPDLPRDGSNLVVRIATAFIDELRRERSLGRARPDQRDRGPAFRKEGFQEPRSSLPARAAADAGAGSTASAGAAPTRPPGTGWEDPDGTRDGNRVNDPAAEVPPGRGVGAVRDAERSGRSNRRRDAEPVRSESGAEGAERAQGRPIVRVTLDKRIPLGAGLGGGSSDAAHTLVALDRLLSAGWAAERLSGFAARFGSDVPFFVHAALGAPSAACRGRGEIVRPVARPAARWAVIFSPPYPLSTRDVYERFDAMGLGADSALSPTSEPAWDEWARLGARELLTRLVNDLEPAAFSLSPDLEALRDRLQQEVGRIVRMSGSGSSLFTLFDAHEESAAHEAAEVGKQSGAASVFVAVTPASG